jgi:hypothetical protein
MADRDDQIVLEPELLPMAQRMLQLVQLAMEKAAAHAADPQRYPMPEGSDSLEGLLLSRFRQLPADRQARAKARAKASLAEPAAMRTQRLGELAKVDLAQATPVADQMRAVATALRISAKTLVALHRRGVPAAETDDLIDRKG